MRTGQQMLLKESTKWPLNKTLWTQQSKTENTHKRARFFGNQKKVSDLEVPRQIIHLTSASLTTKNFRDVDLPNQIGATCHSHSIHPNKKEVWNRVYYYKKRRKSNHWAQCQCRRRGLALISLSIRQEIALYCCLMGRENVLPSFTSDWFIVQE